MRAEPGRAETRRAARVRSQGTAAPWVDGRLRSPPRARSCSWTAILIFGRAGAEPRAPAGPRRWRLNGRVDGAADDHREAPIQRRTSRQRVVRRRLWRMEARPQRDLYPPAWQSIELYEFAKDPLDQKDLSSEHLGVVARLSAELGPGAAMRKRSGRSQMTSRRGPSARSNWSYCARSGISSTRPPSG